MSKDKDDGDKETKKGMKLRDKILKHSTIKSSAMIEESTVFKPRDITDTGIPTFNIALSGMANGGLQSGITVLAGESKRFKTGFGLLLVSRYLKTNSDAVVLFYDSEFGTPKEYWDMFDIDLSRVIHSPLMNLDQLRHDFMVQLSKLEEGEKVIFLVDSIGGLSSKKEVEDALKDDKGTQDMTRAKVIKSIVRMANPQLRLVNVPGILINHVYKEQTGNKHPTDVVSGGQGQYLAADTVLIISRRDLKEDKKDEKKLTGFEFILTAQKSRFIHEKSKFDIALDREYGVREWSGMFDIALDLGWIESPTQGYYNLKGETEKWRRSKFENDGDFWRGMLSKEEFLKDIENKYKLKGGKKE